MNIEHRTSNEKKETEVREPATRKQEFLNTFRVFVIVFFLCVLCGLCGEALFKKEIL
jgi:formate hydrogenlyase subunit 6/NADH:ubiquinone oxidoreductase subunit I